MSKNSNEWGSYTGRLLWAMKRAGKTNQSGLARAVGVKPQSIQHLCDPNAGARGSSHTPSLARELGVSAEWLSTGQGQPVGGAALSTRLGTRESPSPGYAVGSPAMVHPAGLWVTGVLLCDAPQAELQRAELAEPKSLGRLSLPLNLPEPTAVLRVQGPGLAPWAKDGEFLVLQPAGELAQLASQDNLLITLVDGSVRLRELVGVHASSLLASALPVTAGAAEALPRQDIALVELVTCVVPRRWWQVQA